MSAKIAVALIVDHPAAVAVAIKAQGEVRLVLLNSRRTPPCSIFKIFRIWIVVGEGVIKLAVQRDNLAAHGRKNLRRKNARRPVAAGHDDFQPPRQLRPLAEVIYVALSHVRAHQ